MFIWRNGLMVLFNGAIYQLLFTSAVQSGALLSGQNTQGWNFPHF